MGTILLDDIGRIFARLLMCGCRRLLMRLAVG